MRGRLVYEMEVADKVIMGLGFSFVVVFVSILVGWLIGGIVIDTKQFREIKKENKERELYPEYYAEEEKISKLKSESQSYYWTNIYNLRKEIDDIIEDMKYYPAESRAIKETELEKLRIQYRDNVREYNRMEYEIKMREAKHFKKEETNENGV